MSVDRTRWVVLDGSSREFLYDGLWNTVADSSAHLGTLQTTAQSGSSMRFWFNGTEMILFGQAQTGEGRQGLTVSCTVDGTPTTADGRATGNFFACAWKGEASRAPGGTPHSFLLNISSGIPAGSSFSIDSVWYLPSPDSGPLHDELALVEYDHSDPQIDYTSGNWEPLADNGGNAVVASQTGSSATVLFTGTKITWEGWIPSGSGAESSSGTYWVDSGQPTTFTLNPPTSPPNSTVHGINLIEVDGLSSGTQHNLTVVYNGPSTPLVLDHLLVQGGNFLIESAQQPSLSPTLPSSSSAASGPPSPSSSSPPSSIGALAGPIAGGVVGGLAFIAFAVYGSVVARRKRANKLPNPMDPPPRRPDSPRAASPALSLTGTAMTPQSTWTTTGNPSTSPTHSDESIPYHHHQHHLPTMFRRGQEPSGDSGVLPDSAFDRVH